MPAFKPNAHQAVAASQTKLLGPAGAIGDILDGILIIPATTSPGAVAIVDGSTSITVFVGGASSVADLKPFYVEIKAQSKTGPWKVTTGANVSVLASGRFN